MHSDQYVNADARSGSGSPLAWREIDLDAVAHNVALLAARCAPAELMVVVKADAYSHGAVQVARTALAAGASRLGVAVLEEAFELRRGGIDAPVLAWLAAPGAPFTEALARGIELAAYSCAQLAEIAAAARASMQLARVHLKAETGMWRGGAAGEWHDLVTMARQLELEGVVNIVGVWSHLASADDPDDPANDEQLQAFQTAVEAAHDAGLTPQFRHLANSAGTLTRPDMHFDLVRCGLAIYGVDPLADGSSGADLRPAMTVKARVAHVKQAPAGVGVSYAHTYRTTRATTLALVPLGYADGVPTFAGTAAPVGWCGIALPVAGRVCMDQLMIDVGDVAVRPGDEVTLIGPGHGGEFTAAQWAGLSGRNVYDVLTSFSRRRVPIAGGLVGPFTDPDSAAGPPSGA